MFSHRVDEFKQQLYFLHQNITSDSSKMQELQENSEQLEALFNRIDQMEVSDLAHWVYIGQGFIQDFLFGGGGGISIYEKEGGVMRKRGVGDKSLPQLIFQRAESAPPLSSQMSQAALSGGQSLGEGGLLLGGRGGNFCLEGEIPGFPPPCMKPCRYAEGHCSAHSNSRSQDIFRPI